jgi:hypothetical protein
MASRVKNLLYAQPWLYDLVFPEAAQTELTMCLTSWTCSTVG